MWPPSLTVRPTTLTAAGESAACACSSSAANCLVFLEWALTPGRLPDRRKCKEVRCKPMDFADGYGAWLQRSNVCFDPSASVVVQITDTCPCHYPGECPTDQQQCRCPAAATALARDRARYDTPQCRHVVPSGTHGVQRPGAPKPLHVVLRSLSPSCLPPLCLQATTTATSAGAAGTCTTWTCPCGPTSCWPTRSGECCSSFVTGPHGALPEQQGNSTTAIACGQNLG
jgi:hypothetical protein